MSRRSTTLGLALSLVLAAGVSGCGESAGSGGVATEAEVSSPTGPVITEVATTAATVTTVRATTLPPTTLSATTLPETTESVPAPTVAPLFDFMAGSGDGWNVVNDTVMGGVSSGQLAMDGGMLVFTGELSLENNGGFASVRSPLIDMQAATGWALREGPRILAEGDGRTWTVEVRTDELEGGWITELTTSADAATDTTLPWASFRPVTRFLDPREAAAPLDPSRVMSIAFYLVDGIEGPFRLGLRSIS